MNMMETSSRTRRHQPSPSAEAHRKPSTDSYQSRVRFMSSVWSMGISPLKRMATSVLQAQTETIPFSCRHGVTFPARRANHQIQSSHKLKYILLYRSRKSGHNPPRPAPNSRDVFPIVTIRTARDAMDAAASGDLHRTTTSAADGEVVWSGRRDPDVKLAGGVPPTTVAKTATHRGEHV